MQFSCRRCINKNRFHQMTLTIPKQLDETSAFAFLARLVSAEGNSPNLSVQVDFGSLRFAEPFGTLLVGCGLAGFLSRLPPEVPLSPVGLNQNVAVQSYLSHIGFFDLLGLDFGKALGEASGGASYLPITALERGELEAEALQRGRALPEVIQTRANSFAAVLTQKREIKSNRPIAYCLREIIRNVFEHAETDVCLVAAQRWQDETVEIAIVDEGRGIRSSLAERHAFDDDESALRAALSPGVSRAAPANGDGEEDFWKNSGFGLYVLSELGYRLGSFTLCSGGVALRAAQGRDKVEVAPFAFQGTAVRLRVRRPKGENFEELIKQIIHEGEERTGEAGAPRRASRSTRAM